MFFYVLPKSVSTEVCIDHRKHMVHLENMNTPTMHLSPATSADISLSSAIPRDIARGGTLEEMCAAMSPWLFNHPCFTREALYALLSLEFPGDLRGYEKVLDRGLAALRVFKYHHDERGNYVVTHYPSVGPLRICEWGITVDTLAPDPDLQHVETCRRWVREHCRASTKPNEMSTSVLAHRVARWSGADVSEGALQAALIAEGYCVRQRGGLPTANPHAQVRGNSAQGFRGVVGKVVPPAGLVPGWAAGSASRRTADSVPRKTAAQKVASFLERLRDRADVGGEEPTFRAEDLRQVFHYRGDPKTRNELAALFREAGCVQFRRVEVERGGERGVRRAWRWKTPEPRKIQCVWARFRDMPRWWQDGNQYKWPELYEAARKREVTP